MRDPTTCNVLYKILTPLQVENLPETEWAGTELDVKDGFIHLSTSDQLAGTLERFFSAQPGVGDQLFIYTLPRSQIDRPRTHPVKFRFDPAAGSVFGHIYGKIDPKIDFTSSQEVRRTGPNDSFVLGDLTF